MKPVLEIVQEVVEYGSTMQVGQIEAYVSNVRELEVEVTEAKVENLQQAAETGLSVRVISHNRLGFAYTTDLSPEGVKKVVQEAIDISKVVPPDPLYALPEPAPFAALELQDPDYGRVSVEDKINLAKEIERAALRYDPRVKKVRMAKFSERVYEVAIANSLGLVANYAGTGFSGFVMAIAEADGVAETGYGFDFNHRLAKLDPLAIGAEAARRSVEMLGAKKVSSQRADVIFDPTVATEFLGVIAPALTGDAVQKGKSLFHDKQGRQIASEVVTMVDDGRHLAGAAAAPVDDEGVPTRRTELITNGVLHGFLHNLYTAAKAGVAPTGNGWRSSFRGRPESSTSNFYLLPGEKTPEAIISGVSRGLYVTSVMGMHTANPISGDFSVGASGLWVENGEVAYPVRGVAIAGNIVDFLKSIVEVGNDLRFIGSTGSPTFRVAGISISG